MARQEERSFSPSPDGRRVRLPPTPSGTSSRAVDSLYLRRLLEPAGQIVGTKVVEVEGSSVRSAVPLPSACVWLRGLGWEEMDEDGDKGSVMSLLLLHGDASEQVKEATPLKYQNSKREVSPMMTIVHSLGLQA